MTRFFSRYKFLLSDIGLVYAAAIWGSTFFLVKFSLNSINPVTLTGYRFLLAALLMAVILKIYQKNFVAYWKDGLFLGILMWLLYIPQTIGLLYTSASNSGFITGLFVAFVPIFSFILFRTLPEAPKLFAVILSAAGLFLLTGGFKTFNLGDGLTLITAIAYAAHILFTGKFMKNRRDPYVITFQQFLTVGILSIFASFIFQQSFIIDPIANIWIVIFLAVFPTLSAFLIQMMAQRYTTAVKVAIIFALEPVFAAVFAWTLGGEKFTYVNIFGGSLIVLAMIISELPINYQVLKYGSIRKKEKRNY